MSDAYKSIKSRYLSSDEKRLLSALLLKAGITKTVSWIDSISIFPFDDGGMGSYYFLECHSIQVASDILFLDSDGVCVLATLYVNNNYEPCEVDMWKMDYSSLKQIPQVIIDVRDKNEGC
jgi:hypothetical protein